MTVKGATHPAVTYVIAGEEGSEGGSSRNSTRFVRFGKSTCSWVRGAQRPAVVLSQRRDDERGGGGRARERVEERWRSAGERGRARDRALAAGRDGRT
jgi:hypothetical protein